jgi:Tfp pilus assembly protein PilV
MRGVTIVELLIACALALVGVTVTLMLAADVVAAGARVRERAANSAEACVALYRMRSEVENAQTLGEKNNIIAVTQNNSGIIYKSAWQVATFEGKPMLTRIGDFAATPQKSNVVAKNVRRIEMTNAKNAITLALTTASKNYPRVLKEVIRKWGQTL